jgi:hypothetical protein
MDWQQAVTLGIVALTAGVFVWSRLRPRNLNQRCGAGCGCSGAASSRSVPAITFRARKGERPQIIMHNP